jgi:hypothetical protein
MQETAWKQTGIFTALAMLVEYSVQFSVREGRYCAAIASKCETVLLDQGFLTCGVRLPKGGAEAIQGRCEVPSRNSKAKNSFLIL